MIFVPSILTKRLDLAYLLQSKGLTDSAAEIGVLHGDFSAPFMEIWKGRRLYLVDPFMPTESYPGNKYAWNVDKVMGRFKKWEERVFILCVESVCASACIKPESLDFVYVDADHSYEKVAEDLRIWWDRLKPGGVLAGHDLFCYNLCGVTAAVAEFCVSKGVVCYVIDGEYRDGVLVNAMSFYMEKPECNSKMP